MVTVARTTAGRLTGGAAVGVLIQQLFVQHYASDDETERPATAHAAAGPFERAPVTSRRVLHQVSDEVLTTIANDQIIHA